MKQQPKKILIVRFSSIGDILLVTPLLRILATQAPTVEVHFITKHSFRSLLEFNPHVKKLHTFEKDFDEIIGDLKHEAFDQVIDLHNNLRSRRLCAALACPVSRFNKLNLRKLAAVYFKNTKYLPAQHIVERYFAALSVFNLQLDNKGLELFIPEKEQVNSATAFSQPLQKFIALVIGGSYATKQIPYNKLVEIIQQAKLPVLLMGGPEDRVVAQKLLNEFPNLYSAVGNYNLLQSASLISQAEWVVTGDTGLMHMAAAFNKKIISLWGNTIPEFGMSPYLPNSENRILEIKELPCRPCSKLGYHACPAGHFKCMQLIDTSFASDLV